MRQEKNRDDAEYERQTALLPRWQGNRHCEEVSLSSIYMSIDRWTDCLSTEEVGNIENNVAEQAGNT